MLRNLSGIDGSKALSSVERLTFEFQEWEQRGRGWQLWPHPVELEPPFRPFSFHRQDQTPRTDDGRKPTFLTAFVDRFLGAPIQPQPLRPPNIDHDPEPRESFTCPMAELQLKLPSDLNLGKETMIQLLQVLASPLYTTAFEIFGTSESIILQIACPEFRTAEIQHLLSGYAPSVIAMPEADFLSRTLGETDPSVIVDFGLSETFMRPLPTYKKFEPDPLVGILCTFQEIRAEERAILQILFQRAQHPWADSMLRAVTDLEGKDFFIDAPDLTDRTREKTATALHAVVIRVAAQSLSEARSWDLVRTIGAGLLRSAPGTNQLIPLENEDYELSDHLQDLLNRQTRRTGMLLNAEELLSCVHLPSASLKLPRLHMKERKTKAAPVLSLGHQLVLGENIHLQETQTVTLSPDQRLRHTYVIGTSGTGKSTLLLNLITQDMKLGNGIAVLDPHGDLIDEVLAHTPENRIEDVILLDPSDEQFPIPFNILSAHSEAEKTLLASDLVGVFRKLSTSWGDQMNSVLSNAIIAFLESSTGGTLSDLRRFLIEPEYRKQFLQTVNDPEVVYYWTKEFSFLSGKPQGPILTRLDTFLRPKVIRNMVCQKENRLDFRAIMDGKKIFLAKLSHGAIGEENSYLLGSFIVSKIHQAAMGRQNIQQSQRQPFYLYIDEFHHFVTPSMASAIEGDRKYRLGMILAHQELRQLWNKDTDVAGALISNPYTRVCFRVGDFDAQKLKEGFSSFDAKDLQNLGTGEAICRIERSEYDFNLKTVPGPTKPGAEAEERIQTIIALSRQKFAIEIVFQPEPSQEPISETIMNDKASPPPENEKPSDSSIKSEQVRPQPRTNKQRPTSPIPTPGRGGQQHKYLQSLIKRIAEDKGYRATIEAPVLDGAGSVDVLLERDHFKIACEISIASSPDQELHNVRKCLSAGFSHVLLICAEQKSRKKIETILPQHLSGPDLLKVQIIRVEDLTNVLQDLPTQQPGSETVVKGYKVRVNYHPVGASEKSSRRGTIGEIILRGVKKLKS